MSGRTAVIVGAAGGCGTSLVASGLATLWARAGRAAILIDLDRSGGDLAGSWGVTAPRTLDDLHRVAGGITPNHLSRAVGARDGGPGLLAAGAGSLEWDAASCAQLMRAAADAGDVVADAGAGSHAGAGALDVAGNVILVCPSTVAGARRADALIRRWRDAAHDERMAVAWAHGPGRPELGARALGRALGANVVARLPWSPAEARELGSGRWPAGRRRPLRAAIEAMSEALA